MALEWGLNPPEGHQRGANRMSISHRLPRIIAGVIVAAACIAFSAPSTAIAQTKDGAKDGAKAPTKPPRKDGPVDYWEPLWMQRELWGPGEMPPGMRARVLRHYTYVNYGVPREYHGARSTVAEAPDAVDAGRKLYAERCASCHGGKGLGDGNAANSLLPSPALLAFMVQRPISVDEYLLWAVADGGKQFNTGMPAFKDTLSRRQIWEIIAYMRAGFPEAGPAAKSK